MPTWKVRIPEGLAWWVGWGVEAVGWATGWEGTFSRGVIMDATRERYASIEKARRILDYRPRVGLQEAIRISCQVSAWMCCDENELMNGRIIRTGLRGGRRGD